MFKTLPGMISFQLFILLSLLFVFSYPAISADSDSSLLEKTKATDTIVVGIGNEVPFSYLTSNEKLKGVSITILRNALENMGIHNLNAKITPFSSLIPGLAAGQWDVVAAGLNINADRCKYGLFSNPTLVLQEVFMVPKANPKDIVSLHSVLNNPNVTVGAPGGTYEIGMLKNVGVPSSRIKHIKGVRAGADAIKAGRLDAYLGPKPTVASVAEEDPEIGMTEVIPDSPPTGSGFVFRKKDKAFVKKFNKALEKYKSTDEYRKLLASANFGNPDKIGVTTEQLCKNPG